jgi:hypothetical protein
MQNLKQETKKINAYIKNHKRGDVGSLATYSYRSQEEEMEWWSNRALETEERK